MIIDRVRESLHQNFPPKLARKTLTKAIRHFFVTRKLKIDWSQAQLYETFHYKTQLQIFYFITVVFIISPYKGSREFCVSLKFTQKNTFSECLHTTPSKGFLAEWTFCVFSKCEVLVEFVISEKLGENESEIADGKKLTPRFLLSLFVVTKLKIIQ